MNKALNKIINELREEGKDYSDFRTLLSKIKECKEVITKNDILELVATDYRIQLHTTPNSIAILVAHLANRNQALNAIDICCGTGNILYYLQNTIDDLTGVEIVDNIALLTSYFIPDLHIITDDTFKYPFSKKYDLVVGNIPWGMKVEYNGKRISGEEAFIRKAVDLCTESGEVILLVPYTVLVSSQFQQLRQDFNSKLKEIVSLPAGAIRNTAVKTALLVLGNNKVDSVITSQLSQFEKLTEEYVNITKTEILKDNLKERWDPDFHLLKESSFYKELGEFKTVQLQELAEILNGRNIPSDKLLDEGQLLYLKPVHIKDGKLIVDKSFKYVNKSELREPDYKCIVQPGDIVISTIFNDLKMYIYSSNDIPAFASNNLAIIRSSKQDYILSYLQTEEGKRIFKTQAEDLRKGVTIPHLSIKDLASIKIPIFPLSELNKLGNQSISKATSVQLEEALELLREYKQQIEELKQENTNSLKVFLDDRFYRIESQLNIVNQKLDKLLDILKELKMDFDSVRALPREDEEKLFKLCQKIDGKLDAIYSNETVTIEGYIEEIKRWLDLWELLDLQSQKFLPIAEFIFDELSKIPDADYSPFVVQYCRTLENEVLKKLFESYHSSGLKNVNRNELVKDDLENENTSVFAKMVLKDDRRYELGKMSRIMSYLKEGGKTLNGSKLLKHFRAFTINYFDEQIIEATFLEDIKKLTNDFRNKAAHPYSVGIDMAKQCQKLLRKSLNVFLESLKNR